MLVEIPKMSANNSQVQNSPLKSDSPKEVPPNPVLALPHTHWWTCASHWPRCPWLMIHAESTLEALIFIALFWENYPIWQSFWPQGHLTDPNEQGQMGVGEELHHQIVQCLKNVGFGMMQVLSCALPRIRGRCSPLGQGSEVSVFLAEAPKPVLSLQQSSLPGGGVTAVESRSCARGEKKVFQISKRTSLGEKELGESGSPKQGQESWNKVHVARTKDLNNCKI